MGFSSLKESASGTFSTAELTCEMRVESSSLLLNMLILGSKGGGLENILYLVSD